MPLSALLDMLDIHGLWNKPNYHYAFLGIFRNMILGDYDHEKSDRSGRMAAYMAICGCVILLAIGVMATLMAAVDLYETLHP